MKPLLKSLKGRLIAEGIDRLGRKIQHYLLPDGRVLEVCLAQGE